ncbi:MAG: hypothetical protein U1D30_14770 [Planctomycetota bacterium]
MPIQKANDSQLMGKERAGGYQGFSYPNEFRSTPDPSNVVSRSIASSHPTKKIDKSEIQKTRKRTVGLPEED